MAPLPSVDLPTIVVGASQPGADPATMASSVAAPLERRLGAIAGVSEMTSTSSLGTTSIVVQFDLSRSVEGAARDVQAAINAAGSRPAGRPAQPALFPQGQSRRRAGADHVDGVRHRDAGRGLRRRRQRRLAAHRPGAGRLPGASSPGAEQPAIRVTIDPAAAKAAGVGLEAIRQAISQNNVTQATGLIDGREQSSADHGERPAEHAGGLRPGSSSSSRTAPSSGSPRSAASTLDVRDRRQGGTVDGKPAVVMIIFKQSDANVIQVVDGVAGPAAAARALAARRHHRQHHPRPVGDDPRQRP